MKRFQKEIDTINSVVALFNNHLAREFRIPGFDKETAIEQKNIVEIIHGNWDAFPYPNNGTRGVYFLFGHERIQTAKNGIYIGKASFRSACSARLYAHLNPHRTKEHFVMNGYRGEVYILDYMASIDLDRLGLPFMASALEEYLISSLKSALNLINGTGN